MSLSSSSSKHILNYLGVSFSCFWKWWSETLVDLYASLVGHKDSKLLVTVNDQGDIAYENTNIDASSIKHIQVKLPDTMLMNKVVNMPLMTDRNVDKAVTYEFDKYFPFSMEHVYFTYRIGKSENNKTSRIEMWSVNRGVVDNIISKIKISFGDINSRVSICDIENREIFSRLKGSKSQRKGIIQTYFSGPMLWLQLALLLAIPVYPVIGINARIAELEAEINTIKKNAHYVLSLKSSIVSIESRLIELSDLKQNRPSTLRVLSDLSGFMKKNGTFDRFKYSDMSVEVSGAVNSVENLVKKIDANEKYYSVKIGDSVRKVKQSGKESIKLSYMVKNGKQEK